MGQFSTRLGYAPEWTPIVAVTQKTHFAKEREIQIYDTQPPAPTLGIRGDLPAPRQDLFFLFIAFVGSIAISNA